MRASNCGSSMTDSEVFTGAIVVLCSPANTNHSSVVRVRKISRSSRWSSVLPLAWSAYFEPGQRSNRSGRSTPRQKFSQKLCSLAMNNTCPSADS